jgi:type IV pilus assembly protein PilC
MGLFLPRLSARHMHRLTFHVSSLYRSGVSIRRAFELLADKAFPRPLRCVGGAVAARLGRGETLAQALARERHVPVMAQNLLAIGEISGGLDCMLEHLHRHYEKRLAIQRKALEIAAYPILLIVAALIIDFLKGAVLTNEAIDVYVTRYFGNLAWFLGSRLAVTVMLLRILDQWGYLKPIVDNITARVWPINPVFVPLALARFFRSLQLMLDSGAHVVTALELAVPGASNGVIERKLASAIPAVQAGTPILEAVAAKGVLPELVRSMLLTGERAGKTEENLSAAADFLEAEALTVLRLYKAGLAMLFILIVLGSAIHAGILMLMGL